MSPRDPSSGLPTGKRQHPPLTITKTWDSSSPHLMEAYRNRETLLEVVIEIVERPDTGAPERLVARITLTNGLIVDVRPHVGPAAMTGRGLTDFTLTFEKIEQKSFGNWTRGKAFDFI
jgi:type VI secretion system secreted protein Hcp